MKSNHFLIGWLWPLLLAGGCTVIVPAPATPTPPAGAAAISEEKSMSQLDTELIAAGADVNAVHDNFVGAVVHTLNIEEPGAFLFGGKVEPLRH